MDNPYQAPVETHGRPKVTAESDSHPSEFGGRLSIIFVALVLGAVSVLSLIGFLYNLTIDLPGTGRPVIVVAPLWMLGHIVRGVGLGVLTSSLWRYQAAIGKCQGGESARRLAETHNKTWRTGALVLGTVVVYAIIYVAITGGKDIAPVDFE